MNVAKALAAGMIGLILFLLFDLFVNTGYGNLSFSQVTEMFGRVAPLFFWQ